MGVWLVVSRLNEANYVTAPAPLPIMKTEDQFEAQKMAIQFQKIYYPDDCLPKQPDQAEAIRFAFAQGFEIAKRAEAFLKTLNLREEPSAD